MAVHPVLTLRDLLRVVVEQEVDLDAELHFSIEDVDGVDAEGEDVRVTVEGEFNYAGYLSEDHPTAHFMIVTEAQTHAAIAQAISTENLLIEFSRTEFYG